MSNITQIPINSINILNPRSRNKRIFETIIANIGMLGLKKPITVTPRGDTTTEKLYDLVCGQGRLEAYQSLGYETIPAIIIETGKHDAYLMSLVENIARRRHTPVELLKEIIRFKEFGLSAEQIGAKLDLNSTYIYTAMHLLEHGELTLLKEVECGHIPVSVAMKISTAADQDLQAALREAYTSGELRGAQLLATKRYLAKQKKLPQSATNKKRPSAQAAVRAYKQFTTEHKSFVKRARQTEQRLLLITSALKTLFADEHFTTLLRAEQLDTIPTVLADRMKIG